MRFPSSVVSLIFGALLASVAHAGEIPRDLIYGKSNSEVIYRAPDGREVKLAEFHFGFAWVDADRVLISRGMSDVKRIVELNGATVAEFNFDGDVQGVDASGRLGAFRRSRNWDECLYIVDLKSHKVVAEYDKSFFGADSFDEIVWHRFEPETLYLALEKKSLPHHTELYRVKIGGPVVRIGMLSHVRSDLRDSDLSGMAISPDSRQIVYTVGGGVKKDQTDFIIVRSDITGENPVVIFKKVHAFVKEWSDDGNWISIVTARGDLVPRWGIEFIRPDGSGRTRLIRKNLGRFLFGEYDIDPRLRPVKPRPPTPE